MGQVIIVPKTFMVIRVFPKTSLWPTKHAATRLTVNKKLMMPAVFTGVHPVDRVYNHRWFTKAYASVTNYADTYEYRMHCPKYWQQNLFMYIKIFAGKQLDFNILYRHSYVNNRRKWPLALLHPGMWGSFWYAIWRWFGLWRSGIGTLKMSSWPPQGHQLSQVMKSMFQ